MICIPSNNDRHPAVKTFTSFHYTCRHFSSSHLKLYPPTLHSTLLHLSALHFFLFKLHPTTLHYTSLLSHFANPIYISCRFISPHITTRHLASLLCTFRRFSPHFCSFHFTSFITPLFLNLKDCDYVYRY